MNPELWFRHDAQWQEVEFSQPAKKWADHAAHEAWRRAGRKPERKSLRVLVDGLTGLAVSIARQAPLTAFVLCPEPWAGIVTVAQVGSASLAPETDRDDVIAELTADEAGLESVEPALVDELDTAAGPAIRVRLRLTRSDPDGPRAVQDHVLYAWLDRPTETLIVLSAAFSDPLAWARWLGTVDEFASGLQLDRDGAQT